MTIFVFSLLLFFFGNYLGVLFNSLYDFRYNLLLLAVCSIVPIFSKKYKTILPYCVSIFMLFFGLWNGVRVGPEQELQAFYGRNVIVSGLVEAFSWKEKDGFQSFILQVDNIHTKNSKIDYHDKVRVTIKTNEKIIGKKVVVSGTLQEIIGFRNPGVFDSKKYNRINRIGAKLAQAKLIKSQDQSSLVTKIVLLNRDIRKVLTDKLSNRAGNVLGGMLFGRSDIDDESRDIFADNGLNHLLSVSGTHMALLSGLLLVLLKRLPSTLQKILIISILSLYAVFCGLKPPSLRAVLMSSIVLFGGSGVEKGRLLGLAGIFLLLYKPLWILDLGFQLSFGASLGLVFLFPKIKTRLETIFPDIIAEGFSVTIAVQLMTLPLLIDSFNQVSVISLISNILFLPILELAAIFAVLGVAFFYIFNVQSIIGLSGFFIEQILIQAEFLGKLPFSTIAIARFPSWSYVIYYALLVLWVDIAYIKNLDNRERRLAIKVLSSILFCIFLWTNFWPRSFTAYFLDVGQGDCAVIITPWRRVIVVDTGGLKNFDTGMHIVTPFLRSLGKKSIDYLLLSHYDTDHVGGLKGLLRNVKVGTIIMPNEKITESSRPFYELCINSDAEKIVASKGMRFTIDGADIDIIDAGDYNTQGNEASTVARVSYQGRSFLFTGDMDEKREEEITYIHKTDVLKVAHHGSKSSSTENFLACVQPQIAVISVGAYNRYGHPHETVLERLQNIGAKVLRTDKSGCVKIELQDL